MDMPKLLIADSDEEFRLVLCDKLKDHCILRSCTTGSQALELLQTFRPDVLVLDLMLPEIDGITLLHRAADAHIHPTVLALTSFQSSYITNAAAKLGVNCIITKPCDVAGVAAHVMDMAAEAAPAPISELDLYDAVTGMLLNLGISTKHDGFAYLQLEIPLFAKDPSQAVTKVLYPAVAKQLNKNPRQIERSTRTAIEVAWKKCDKQVWQQYFHAAPDGSIPKPTNKVFVSHLANMLNRQILSWHSA